ncbi:uncharacterized protein B0P05DRAFT_544922 [Gilbertella persicaria]|uniref:uncharacterized protein n=1 Tax=Gilbertella persicaria TaxID=101096 RepID=UPI00221EAE47|nr:uncharacterized protein B0P05DRAFT_544922 [Gilbertella persicaria]KAI8077402.1 hypothetical protein B0P05DRAFT_544922 [Gilbertella persicaria]
MSVLGLSSTRESRKFDIIINHDMIVLVNLLLLLLLLQFDDCLLFLLSQQLAFKFSILCCIKLQLVLDCLVFSFKFRQFVLKRQEHIF